MQLNQLTAISPIDGRYRSKTELLSDFFSEFGLIKYRVQIEVEYFIALCEAGVPALKGVNIESFSGLREVYTSFSLADAQKVRYREGHQSRCKGS